MGNKTRRNVVRREHVDAVTMIHCSVEVTSRQVGDAKPQARRLVDKSALDPGPQLHHDVQ